MNKAESIIAGVNGAISRRSVYCTVKVNTAWLEQLRDFIREQEAEKQELVNALQDLIAADNCNYARNTMRSEGYFSAARKAVANAEKE